MDGVVDVAVHELFVQGALDGVDKCFLGAVGAKSRTQWFEESSYVGLGSPVDAWDRRGREQGVRVRGIQ